MPKRLCMMLPKHWISDGERVSCQHHSEEG